MKSTSSSVLPSDKAPNSGASFTGLTVNVNEVLSVSLPSVTETSTKIEPLKSWPGVNVKDEPSTTTSPLSLDAVNVKVSPSTSEADKSKLRDWSSSIAWSAIEAITGASFTGLTVKVKAPTSLLWPSLTVIVTSISPL